MRERGERGWGPASSELGLKASWGWGPSERSEDVGLESSLASADPSPEETAAHEELRQAIVAEIRALPAKLRDALLLAQSGEYTYEEIGAMLGTAVGTIKWRVSEARKAIKTRLRERGFADVG
jgi:RNA polymerase sigma-70 factor, ECF subfamily